MNPKDAPPALIFLGMGLIGLWAIYRLPLGTISAPDTAFFPAILTGLLILLSLILLGRSRKEKIRNHPGEGWALFPKLIPPAAVLILYAFLLKPLGYVVSTTAIVLFFARMAHCSWRTALTISVLCTFLSYALFRWYLQSPLPQGIVPF